MPSRYNPADHYWIVAGDETKLFSSALGEFVKADDERYRKWADPEPAPDHPGDGVTEEEQRAFEEAVAISQAAQQRPSRIISEEELVDVLRPYAIVLPTPAGLAGYIANARWAREVGGIVVDGNEIPTDRDTQAKLTGAFAFTQIKPDATFEWKLGEGDFVTLDATKVQAIAAAVAAHVQACYAAEARALPDIKSGKLKTRADVDAIFSALKTE